MPVPASACQMLPIVYFRHGSSAIEAPGREALDGLVQQLLAQGEGLREILIVGHSDRTGPRAARRRIALRRAEGVRDYLLARGLVPSRLRIEGASDSRPMTETPEGVRQPTNRRAEIQIAWTQEAVAARIAHQRAEEAAGRPTPLC